MAINFIENLKPKIMGVLNVTPDSFSDGGKFSTQDKALQHCLKMLEEGADIIDIGGESTRPGAKKIEIQEEINRTIPVIKKIIKQKPDCIISIDTNKAEVMQQALENGCQFVNDINALQNEGCLEVLATNKCNICIMHMQGTPQNMQQNPNYENVLKNILEFFELRLQKLQKFGIATSRVYLDPGFGFGKLLEHNIELFKNIETIKKYANKMKCAGILIGVSKKSMIGQLTQITNPQERILGSVIAATIAMMKQADIIRVHDVAETAMARVLLKQLL